LNHPPPDSENGLVCLVTCGDVQQATLIRSLLQAHGIQVHIQGEHARALQGIWGVQETLQVLVPRERLAEAEALLDAEPEGPAVPEPLAEDEASAASPTVDRRARKRRIFAWAVIAFLVAPLFLVAARIGMEARDRPTLQAWQSHLRQGEAAEAAGRLYDAEQSYRQAVTASEALPRSLPERMDAHFALARVHLHRERWTEAEALARRVLAEDSDLGADGSLHVADDLMVLGRALAGQHRDQDAIGAWLRAAGLYQERGSYSDAAGAHLQIGLQHAYLGRPRPAVASLQQARGLYRLSFDADPRDHFVALAVLASRQEELGQPEEVVQVAREALHLGQSGLEGLESEREELLAAQVRALRALGRMKEAAEVEGKLRGDKELPDPEASSP
jgi:tetratricopeptide (TPR) repeat protein